MVEHHASVTVDAPVHQVYELFTHFNDFPKFMSFVKEVTYYDDQNSHWVAEVVGRHQWDAVNQNWLQDQQIGWVSTNGLKNSGRVTFKAVSPDQTLVDVFISYDPPAGVIGDIGENLGAGDRFEAVLQHDLDNFAEMVRQAPVGALDPASSSYLFHPDSAAAKGKTTNRQDATMTEGENATEGYQPVLDRDIIGESATGLPSGRVPPGFPEHHSDTPGLPDPTEPRDPGTM
jgi:ribosome-associated toxin RatA of RatAB toxin-antitoxin module